MQNISLYPSSAAINVSDLYAYREIKLLVDRNNNQHFKNKELDEVNALLLQIKNEDFSTAIRLITESLPKFRKPKSIKSRLFHSEPKIYRKLLVLLDTLAELSNPSSLHTKANKSK